MATQEGGPQSHECGSSTDFSLGVSLSNAGRCTEKSAFRSNALSPGYFGRLGTRKLILGSAKGIIRLKIILKRSGSFESLVNARDECE